MPSPLNWQRAELFASRQSPNWCQQPAVGRCGWPTAPAVSHARRRSKAWSRRFRRVTRAPCWHLSMRGWRKLLDGDSVLRAAAVVNLAYERDAIGHPLDSFGFVVPHVENRPVLACTFSSIKYSDRAPDGKVLLRAFLGGAVHPEAVEWSDERLVQTVHDELKGLLGVNQPPLFSRIKRWRRFDAAIQPRSFGACGANRTARGQVPDPGS